MLVIYGDNGFFHGTQNVMPDPNPVPEKFH